MGFRYRDAGCGYQGADCRLRVSVCRMRNTGCGMQVVAMGCFLNRHVLTIKHLHSAPIFTFKCSFRNTSLQIAFITLQEH